MDSLHKNTRRAFTVIELLVVIAVIGIVVSLLLPAVQQAREAAHRMTCRNHLRQLALALHNYESAHAVLPPSKIDARNYGNGSSICDEEETTVEDNPTACTEYQSWTALCLPFFDQSTLANSYDYQSPWSNLCNREAVSTHLPIFLCPSASGVTHTDEYHVKGAATTHYGAVIEIKKQVFTDTFGVPNPGLSARIGTLAEHRANRPRDVIDGMSQTIMLAESAGRPGVFVNGRPMTAAQFSEYTDDEIVETPSGYIVEDGIGWADPDTGLHIKGAGPNGLTVYGPRFINAINTEEAYSFHTGGAHFVFADGSVQFLSEEIDSWTFISLCTRAGGEIVGEF